MRLLILLSSTHVGGAERMTITLANQLARHITMKLVVGRTGQLHDQVDPVVDCVDLGVTRMRQAVRPLCGLLRDWSPTVVFAPQVDASVTLALAWRLAGKRGALVLRESNYRSGQARLSIWDPVTHGLQWAYRQAAVVVAPARDIADDLISRYRLQDDRVRTIHNPVDVARIRAAGNCVTSGSVDDRVLSLTFSVVAVGRLVPQKGFDILLQAFSKLCNVFADKKMSLTILGEGPERLRLEQLVSDLGIVDAVRLPGLTETPYITIAEAQMYVLSSRWEGFPNGLAEAMALGVPPVAFRCPGGTAEIIEHGLSGLLCAPESVNELSEAMGRLVQNDELRNKLASGAAERALAFDSQNISLKYLRLFEDVAHVGSRNS